MADEGADEASELRARVEELEGTVDELRSTVEEQRRAIAYLAADADLGALEPTCPDCGSEVTVQSGLTWQRFECSSCGLQEYL